MVSLYGLATDDQGVAHGYRRVLTLCGERVDAGRWSMGTRMLSGPSAEVTCTYWQWVLGIETEREGAAPTAGAGR